MNVLKGESAIKKYGEKGKNGVIEISKKNGNIIHTATSKTDTVKFNTSNANIQYDKPVYFVDGKEVSKT